MRSNSRADDLAEPRRERVIENQQRARAKNADTIVRAGIHAGPILGLVCECGLDSCGLALVMTGQEYARMRQHPHYFAVTPEHVCPGVDLVREQHLRYVVVETPGA